MREVFKHTPTGDLYAVKSGYMNRLIDFTGMRYVVIEQVTRLFDLKTEEQIPDSERSCQYLVMNNRLAYEMVVSKAEFDSQFVEVEELGAVQNSDIDELLRRYEQEGCNFSDISSVVSRALSATQVMRDSRTRCSLYALAKHVEASLPAKVVLPD